MTTGDMDRPSEGERPGAVDDAVWTELVASFHASTADRPDLWPDAENLPGDSGGNATEAKAPNQGGPADAGAGGGPGVNAIPAAPSRVVRPASRPDVPASAPPAVTWTAAGPRDWDTPAEPREQDGFV
ncbi:MAG: hypothetical protein ACRDSS_14450, partial [Actinocrinis sp.]